MTVRIVTDSSCDLSAADIERHRITVVPLTIRFGEEEFTDGVGLSAENFYEKMAASGELPSTAAPAPGAFEAAFRGLASEGAEAVVCVNLSFALSATGESAQAAARATEGEVDVRVVDSGKVSVGLGVMVKAAAAAAAAGHSADEIEAQLAQLKERVFIYAVLDTLENLKKGGRIGTAQALLGSALSIKPCLDLTSGVVEEAGKQRTRGKARNWLASRVAEAGELEHLAIAHGAADDIDAFVANLGESPAQNPLTVALIGPVVGTHAGPGVIAAAMVPAP
ncbi:MAG: DegV family protein [Acidimicrobiia bacterium]|nr:DegV family protein [bacterium]MXW58213.1 DegV family protein [Acidimicrobiia bacterium]MDE0613312.1 DegV family protein [bacterium]MYB09008.1 DegV family protein [Acidimicrobiia bacterium]MYB72847.1 DegV family protein [Acidimicrobiia bacterium]